MSPRVFASRLERISETLHPTDPTYCAELLDFEDARWLLAVNEELITVAKGLLDDISGEVRDPLNIDLDTRPEDDPLIAMKWIKALAQVVSKAERGE